MLFLTIPHRPDSAENLFELLGLQEYKRKRLGSPPDTELEVSSPKIRKTSQSDKFGVKLDVSHFKPEDIKIKTDGKDLIVEGKHGERLDESGYVSRHFTRRYELPNDIDLEKIISSLSSDGKLSIEAPIKRNDNKERIIPITIEKSIEKTKDVSEEGEDKVIDGA